MNDFGRNFRKLRESAGLSQEGLAAVLKISTSVVNRIENNKRKLDIGLIYKLPEALNMNIGQVVTAICFGESLKNRNGEINNPLSMHYEKIIEEKNQIIREKNRYIDQLQGNKIS
ncbi:helix-turn-helix domain-containing protein [Dyadobacter sp. CY323]|uniref:helix-turn-helix domain-containing protein n=1 Tax=Dyadobacter sp. CY323 TaxID=2907302 RepID=UPI001F446091|nr:helix-turn-helix transcriptional regulator [Dyadobacter sp. CY323]MCE6990621.1 helix-turn-helix domain-containing protein [Dyadobacter sp. CY323]